MTEKNREKAKKGLAVRKEFDIKVDIAKLSSFVNCNLKGVYFIENNIYTSKPIRYLMFMRKHGLNVNKLIDLLNSTDKEHKDKKDE